MLQKRIFRAFKFNGLSISAPAVKALVSVVSREEDEAKALETIVEGDCVDKLDRPHQQDPADQQPDGRPHESRQREAGFGGGGHRHMLRLVGRWLPADADPRCRVIQY